jgi:hypothetical protein
MWVLEGLQYIGVLGDLHTFYGGFLEYHACPAAGIEVFTPVLVKNSA